MNNLQTTQAHQFSSLNKENNVAQATISTYLYAYASGSADHNREIHFKRTEQTDPKTIYAAVFAVVSGELKEISSVKGEDINVEMMTTGDKVRALQAERAGEPFNSKPDQKLCDLSIKGQDAILKGLRPHGTWRVEITNGLSSDPYVERVDNLNLFNPIQ